MKAFFGHEWVKKTVVDRVRRHIINGQIKKSLPNRWCNDSGSAVGCTVHGSDVLLYEHNLGIPAILGAVEDAIFEGLLPAEGRGFTHRVVSVIHPGADLSGVWAKFATWLLEDGAFGTIKQVESRQARAMQRLADVYRSQLYERDELESIMGSLMDSAVIGPWESPGRLAVATAVLLGDAALVASGGLRSPAIREMHWRIAASAVQMAASVAEYAKDTHAIEQSRQLSAAKTIELAGDAAVRQSLQRCLAEGPLQMRAHIRGAARNQLVAHSREAASAMGYIAQAQQLLHLLRVA